MEDMLAIYLRFDMVR